VAEKERTATIVEQAFAGIILLDADLKIVSLNPAAAAIIGREQQQVIGAPLGEVLGRGILNERGSMRRAIATRERVTPTEAVLVAGDRRLDVLLGVTPLRDGYLLSLADITQLKEVDRLKTDIVANVSHEFRTPLAIIKAYTELLMDDDQRGVSTNDQEYLAIIDAETNRLAVMVGQLLDLARLEADRGVIAKTPVVMSEIVNDVVSSLQHEADARAIAVDVCVPRDLPAVPATKELLTTLVRNLLDNAIKFSRKGGKVDVVALREPGSLVLQVVDQGIGISDEDLPLLFEKFYRGSTAKEAGIRGTGLGLVLTKQAVEAHGGSIRVESRRGYGTRFTVTLPLNNGTEPASLDNRSGAKTPLEEPQPSAS
jgi:PAS domain S-box-containing protein